MVFKVTSSSSDESFSAVRIQELLIVSLEDQICLDSLPGWEPRLSEGNRHCDNVAPTLLPAEKTPHPSAPLTHPKAVDEECIIINGGHVGSVKRKIFADHLVEKDSHTEGQSSSVPLQSLQGKTLNREDETSVSKRPRSLPDFGSYRATGEPCVDSNVPSNGKDAAAKEDRRLKSLVSTFRGSLRKDSPVSRSLNSISDIQNHGTSFRGGTAVRADVITNLRNRSMQQCSPSPDATISEGKQGTAYSKKSCVRRLDMDDRSTLSQNAGSSGTKNGQQSFVQKETANVGSCQQASANSSFKRRQLGSFSKTGKNNGKKSVKHIRDSHTPLKSVASGPTQEIPGSSNDFPVSQQYRLGPDTQRALMSGFGEDSLCVSDPGHQRTSRTVPTRTEKSKESLKITVDADDPSGSEEPFPGSQHSGNGNHFQREKNVQQDRLVEVPQGMEPECNQFEHLGTVLSALRKGLPNSPPRGLRFTALQIKSMCEVLHRLHSP